MASARKTLREGLGMRRRLWKLWQSYSGLVLTVISVLSLGGLYAALVFETDFPRESRFASQVAMVVLTGVLVQVLLRYLVWKEAEESFLRYLGIREEIPKAGFERVRPFDSIEWPELFSGCNEIEMLFTSNTTWIMSNITRIKQFLSDPDHSLTVVLRTPDAATLGGLAKRFDEEAAARCRRIEESARVLRSAYEELAPKKRGQLRLLHHPKDATYSYYRFGETAMVVPYKLRPGRDPGEVPVLFFNTAGSIYKDFLSKDFAYVSSSKNGAQEFPPAAVAGGSGKAGP